MNKVIVISAVIVIAVIAFTAGRWTSQSASPTLPARSVPTPVADYDYQYEPPSISESEAQTHRESHYADIQTIDGVLELPSDFAQTEALYTVAGRADRVELEKLILDSMAIVNRYDRSAALSILFSRFVELDPDAAVNFLVELNLDIDDQIISALFETWAKSDLNGAVAAANQLTNTRQRRRASHAILTAASRYHETLIDQVAADLVDNHELGHIRSEAIGIRANRDPQRALQEAMSMDGSRGRWDAIRRVAAVWARNDPAGAMQFLGEISDKNMRRQFIATVMQRWIEDDPLQAMQFVNSHPNVSERQQMLQHSLGAYARINPDDALMVASRLSGNAKVMALQQVISQWATDDAEAALAAVNALGDTTQRNALISSIGQALAHQSTDKALAWLDTLDAEKRASQMGPVIQQIAHQNPRRAIEYVLGNTTESERSGTLSQVLQSAMMNDPVVAQDYLDQLPLGPERDGLYRRLAGHVAQNGGDAVMQWIAGLSGSAKSSALKGAAHSLVGTEPQLSANLVAQMSQEDAAEIMRMVSSSISYRQDPQTALNWLEQFSGRQGYEEALGTVAQAVARNDPQQALAIAGRLSGQQRSVATSTALMHWASTNPVAAANWASRSDDSVRASAVESVVQNWVRSDPASAERWVYSLPDGDGRDRALLRLAGGMPDSARLADIVASISSDLLRQQSIVEGYQRILRTRRDQQAANEFLDNVGASTELRNQLSRLSGP